MNGSGFGVYVPSNSGYFLPKLRNSIRSFNAVVDLKTDRSFSTCTNRTEKNMGL